MTPFAVAGLAAWALLGLVLLPFRGTLVAHGHGWWLWMCLAGVGGGVAGLIVMRRHDANRRRRRAEAAPAEDPAGEIPAEGLPTEDRAGQTSAEGLPTEDRAEEDRAR